MFCVALSNILTFAWKVSCICIHYVNFLILESDRIFTFSSYLFLRANNRLKSTTQCSLAVSWTFFFFFFILKFNLCSFSSPCSFPVAFWLSTEVNDTMPELPLNPVVFPPLGYFSHRPAGNFNLYAFNLFETRRFLNVFPCPPSWLFSYSLNVNSYFPSSSFSLLLFLVVGNGLKSVQSGRGLNPMVSPPPAWSVVPPAGNFTSLVPPEVGNFNSTSICQLCTCFWAVVLSSLQMISKFANLFTSVSTVDN